MENKIIMIITNDKNIERIKKNIEKYKVKKEKEKMNQSAVRNKSKSQSTLEKDQGDLATFGLRESACWPRRVNRTDERDVDWNEASLGIKSALDLTQTGRAEADVKK